MDRFIVREPRVGAEYPHEVQPNRHVTFSTNAGNNNYIIPETMYFGGYGAEFTAVQRGHGFVPMSVMNAPSFVPNIGQDQAASGIDPRYLAAYADSNAAFISGQRQQMQRAPEFSPNFGDVYENRSIAGADRNKPKAFTPQTPIRSDFLHGSEDRQKVEGRAEGIVDAIKNVQNQPRKMQKQHNVPTMNPKSGPAEELEGLKKEFQLPMKTRADKIKELQKTGARVFSGPVEKVLKWHKVLQDLGLLVFYEIVAKCVNVRASESCAKTLVVRDDNGPAMQVVYYEIDFLLPELKPPCTVRIIGRMLAGTCRLQALGVRAAAGDDVATLPRRAAVANHHVAKLCKEFANNN